MCKNKLITGNDNISQNYSCLQRSGLGVNKYPPKSRSVLCQRALDWSSMNSRCWDTAWEMFWFRKKTHNPALWSSYCGWGRKKRYFHNILDAVKCPQVIWSIPCDHNDSLQWDLVKSWEGQPLTKKPPECFPFCLLNPKIIFQVQISWHCFSGRVSRKTSPFKRQSEALLSQYSSVWFCKTVLLDHQIDVQWMLRRWIGFFWAYFAL